jgi:hypothetical protein
MRTTRGAAARGMFRSITRIGLYRIFKSATSSLSEGPRFEFSMAEASRPWGSARGV